MMKKRRRRVQIRKKPKSIGVQEAISEYPEAYHSGYDEAEKIVFLTIIHIQKVLLSGKLGLLDGMSSRVG